MAKKKTIDPFFRWEVKLSESDKIVEVFAPHHEIDGDDLQFVINYDDSEYGPQDRIACFKNWDYFIRRESDLDRASLLWGDKFESLAKIDEEPTDSGYMP